MVSKLIVIPSVIGAAIGGIVLFKEFVGGKNYSGKEQLLRKTVIVTGANTGIGKETAQELAKRGARVIMACRNMTKCMEARREIVTNSFNKNVECEELDLASFHSIRMFSKKINANEKRIDVLVNNAGVMRCPRSTTKEGIELQLGVNHFGHFLLTNLLLDKLKTSAPSRIVVLSSIAHVRGEMNFDDLNSEKSYDAGSAYNQSKLANILFTRELSKQLQGSNVTVNAVHPGIVNTELMRHMGFYKSYISTLFLYPFSWMFLKTPRQGAQTTLYCCLSEDLRNVSGKYFSGMKEDELVANALDDGAAKRLWDISETWTKLR